MKSCQKKLPAVSHLHPASFLKHHQLSEILHFLNRKAAIFGITALQAHSRLPDLSRWNFTRGDVSSKAPHQPSSGGRGVLRTVRTEQSHPESTRGQAPLL